MGGYVPAGGARSTAADMALYTRHLLEEGLPGHTWVRLRDTDVRWHNGGTYGYSTMLVIDPDGRAAFVAGDTGESVDDIALALLQPADAPVPSGG